MAEKTLKTRIIHKHDVESNWLKATNFVPKQGELIVYDKDVNYDYERVKVGDGTTKVNNLPFADANSLSIGGANLYTGTQNFYGNDWANKSSWTEDGSYNGCVVYRRDGRYSGMSQLIALETDEQYTLSAWLKQSDGGEVRFFSQKTNGSAAASKEGTIIDVGTDWSRCYITFTISTTDEYRPRFEQYIANQKIWIAGVKLEKGNKPTDWTPSPEDLVYITRKINNKTLSEDITLTASDIGADISGAAETALTSANNYTDTAIAKKVDKETGKGLSTNDFTTDEKNKLAGIDENANNYTLPTAFRSTLGGVKTTSTVTSTTGLTATPIIDGVPYYKSGTSYSAGTGISITNNTINHSNSLTAKTSYGSTSTSASANGGSFTVTDVKYDAQGHITGSTDRTIKLSQTTYSLGGLMGSSAKGSATQPVYWNGSAWTNTTYTLGASVPSDAKFTDTVYTLPTAGSSLGGVKTTSTVSSTTGLTACPIIGGVPYYKDTNNTYTMASLMGSSAKGSATQPVYWNGTAWANTTYTLGKSVPSDAKFSDTVYTLPTASSTLGGVKTTSNVSSTNGLTASPIINGVVYYKDTTYTLSGLGGVPTSRKVNGYALTADIELTATDVGAVSPEDLQAEGYITGITEADVLEALGYTPANQDLLGDFTGASATQAGDTGLVPAPSVGEQNKFLRGDGTWAAVSTSTSGDYLPLTGGTLTGDLTVNGTISVGASTRATTAENILADKNGVISNADNCLTVGVYATNTSTTNLPFATYGTLTVYKSAQNWIIQTWTSSTDTETSMYMRKNINGAGFGSWFKLLGSDSPVSIAQGGTGGTKLEEAQKNILDGTYPGEGIDLSTLAPGIYALPNDSNTVTNVPAGTWSPLTFVFGHQNNDTATDGSPTGGYFQGYLEWEGELWLRRRKWDNWGEWMKYYSTKNIIYSSTQPSDASTGTIWLKPV